MSTNKKIKNKYTKDCGCKRCDTYAVITEFECGCVKVEIYNDKAPTAECTNFSKLRYTASSCR
jgi:hypothetical protein